VVDIVVVEEGNDDAQDIEGNCRFLAYINQQNASFEMQKLCDVILF
jgi:hypothetical protein